MTVSVFGFMQQRGKQFIKKRLLRSRQHRNLDMTTGFDSIQQKQLIMAS
jgi:hypothetical protein